MLHARVDYDSIQDPRPNGIGEDEPVMLFRAKDALAPLVLDAYADLVQARMDDPELALNVRRHADRMRAWQDANGKKFPDVMPHMYYEDPDPSQEVPETGPVSPVSAPPSNAPDAPAEQVGDSQAFQYAYQYVDKESITCQRGATVHLERAGVVPGTVVMEMNNQQYKDSGKGAILLDGQQVGMIDYVNGAVKMLHGGGTFLVSYEYSAEEPGGVPMEVVLPTTDMSEKEFQTIEGEDTVETPADELEIQQHPADSADEGMLSPPEPGIEVPEGQRDESTRIGESLISQAAHEDHERQQAEQETENRMFDGNEDQEQPDTDAEASDNAEAASPAETEEPESGDKNQNETGPLSEGGAALMGGQPTEHEPGTPDEPPTEEKTTGE